MSGISKAFLEDKKNAEIQRLNTRVTELEAALIRNEWVSVGPKYCVKSEHAVADAFWKYWQENGETHKHGFYESTWGAINAAINSQSPNIGPHERAGCSPWNCWLKDGTKCTVQEQ